MVTPPKVGFVRSMSSITEERAKRTLPAASRARKQTYCPFCSSLFSVISPPEVYAVPSVSLPMRSVSQSSAVMVYLLPALTGFASVMAAVTIFSRAAPAAGPVMLIVGALWSIPVITSDRANEILPITSRARKQTYFPLCCSLFRSMSEPEMYALPSLLSLIREASHALSEMIYRAPAVTIFLSVMSALIVFSCATPVASDPTLMTGLTVSMVTSRSTLRPLMFPAASRASRYMRCVDLLSSLANTVYVAV